MNPSKIIELADSTFLMVGIPVWKDYGADWVSDRHRIGKINDDRDSRHQETPWKEGLSAAVYRVEYRKKLGTDQRTHASLFLSSHHHHPNDLGFAQTKG